MIKSFKIIPSLILIGFLLNCSQVLETVELDINDSDKSLQQVFNVVEKTLTIREAKVQKNAKYSRSVLRSGRGNNAQPIPENLALVSEFPKIKPPPEYRIGIDDTITFLRLIENNRSTPKKLDIWPKYQVTAKYILGIGDTLALVLMKDSNPPSQMSPINRDSTENDTNGNQSLIITSQQSDETIKSESRIGSDGSLLLLEVGRLEAKGKTLNELRSEVRNILIRNGVSPRFQLEISDFKSQKAYLTINSTSKVIILDDQRTTIRDILTSAGVGFKPGVITRIRLQRNRKEFSILLRDLFDEKTSNIDVQTGDHLFIEDSSANIMTTSSVVDTEGNVVLESVGKVKAAGQTLSELRIKIKNLLQPIPDSQNAFQIQITNFASQTALFNAQGKPGVLIPIKDTPAKLSEVLTQNGVSIDGSNITQINLQRNGKTYRFTLDDLLNSDSSYIYIQPEDRITTEVMPYKENKVFMLGGVNPQIFKINPANRETLADILFTSGGALSASNAKRSEVYLLRGSNPVTAYHLDAQSPTRLLVAEAMELRPNDILYVAEQSIISFNRALTTILPLRILLQDIQNDNIP